MATDVVREWPDVLVRAQAEACKISSPDVLDAERADDPLQHTGAGRLPVHGLDVLDGVRGDQAACATRRQRPGGPVGVEIQTADGADALGVEQRGLRPDHTPLYSDRSSANSHCLAPNPPKNPPDVAVQHGWPREKRLHLVNVLASLATPRAHAGRR